MSSRFADPTTMRTRSPIYHDESTRRPPPSPSNKAPPPKKFDAKSRAVSEEPFLPSRAGTISSEPLVESCLDKSSSNRIIIDMEIFGQILELDEEDEREFTRGMVKDYLEQAKATIKFMDDCFTKHDLTQLSKDGHFLKGSSAALGVVQVQGICEKIQHLGNRVDPDKGTEPKMSVEDALARIKPLLARLKDEQATAERWLNSFFEELEPQTS